jgi:hypothetical protein
MFHTSLFISFFILQFFIFNSGNASPTLVPTGEAACSRLTCNELGFPDASTFGDITVCGETDALSLGGECSGEATWEEAEAYCTSAGARLCTATELENDEAADTGCNYNSVPIWSSTVCVQDGGGYGYQMAYGSSASGLLADSCASSNDISGVYVRCCADAYGCTPFPVFEPTPSPSITSAPTSIATCSDKSCNELGWSASKYGSNQICGESDSGIGGCTGFVNWNDAKDTCQQSGARLCTVDELLDDEAKETGCNLDTELVWSATSCESGFYAVSGSTKASDLVCTAISEASTVSTRCCADFGCTSEPTIRPTHLPSAYPTPNPSKTHTPTTSIQPTHPSLMPSSSTLAPTQPSPAPTTIIECSIETCDDLGWTNAESYGSSHVCGETDTENLGGKCSGLLTWDEARDFCQHGGARLCTAYELIDDDARGTGCNYDRELIWSSTACGSERPYKDNTFTAVMGASYTGGSSECYERTLSNVAYARCCADTIGCSPHPTPQPSIEDYTPRPTHSLKPTIEPSPVPTHSPTHPPSPEPSSPAPTHVPSTVGPTEAPTRLPTKEPTPLPTGTPTHPPTHPPTIAPTVNPIPAPTFVPTHIPTHAPTPRPSEYPTHPPTHQPDKSQNPTVMPTHSPSHIPTHTPTPVPTPQPTHKPTPAPTRLPTPDPTHIPTFETWSPTHIPTSRPSEEPSFIPSSYPTSAPSSLPSAVPTSFPTKRSACSSLTCAELGWDKTRSFQYGHDFVCGGSEINGQCSGTISFEDAREFCQSSGARLCEAHELAYDDARDSGCQLNGEVVWSGTPCANNQRSYYVLYGSTDGDRMNHDKDGTFGRQCKTAIGYGAESYPVRCCADVSNDDCMPSQEPTHPPTPLPTSVPTYAPTSSEPTPVPTSTPTILPLTCASPAALYESLMGQTLGSDYTCEQVEVSEVSDGLAQKFCKFSPEECKANDLWESCTFNVRSSALTVHAPPSYTFNAAPTTMFCLKSCTECLVK